MNDPLKELIVSNLNEIIRTNPGTYAAYVAKVTLNKISSNK